MMFNPFVSEEELQALIEAEQLLQATQTTLNSSTVFLFLLP